MRAVFLLAVLLLAACGGSETVATPEQTASSALSATTLDGERISLDDLGDRPVFVVAFSFF